MGAWIVRQEQGLYPADGGKNLIVQFPEWYTEDMWRVDFVWGDEPERKTMPIHYSQLDSQRRTMMGVSKSQELHVTVPGGDVVIINLEELKDRAWAENRIDDWRVPNFTTTNPPVNEPRASTRPRFINPDATFPINAWILLEQDDYYDGGAANVVLEFPEWYTEDIWDVEIAWGNHAGQSLSYALDDQRKMLFGVHKETDENFELRVTVPSGETVVIDL